MKSKAFLITGATKGIGRALTLKFAKEHCQIYALGRNQALLNEVAAYSQNIHPILADITTIEGRNKIVQTLQNEPYFSIIHNAGMSSSTALSALNEQSLRQHFETNFFAPVLLTQAFLSHLKGQRVLHISSGAALQGRAYKLPYCSSKAAMHRAIESLQAELQEHNIYFANVRPGMVDTPMQEELRSEPLPTRDFYIRAQKENQLLAPETVAEFVAWLMLRISPERFSQTFWDIHDERYQHEWRG